MEKKTGRKKKRTERDGKTREEKKNKTRDSPTALSGMAASVQQGLTKGNRKGTRRSTPLPLLQSRCEMTACCIGTKKRNGREKSRTRKNSNASSSWILMIC
jgi:hypothetical protein